MDKCNYSTANGILADAQDLVGLGRSSRNPSLSGYAVNPSLGAQKYLAEVSVVNGKEVFPWLQTARTTWRNLEDPNLEVHDWWFKEGVGIVGSSFPLALRFDQVALRPLGLHIPTLLEAKELDTKGKIAMEDYRDYGIVIMDGEKPNRPIGRRLVTQANDLGLELPLIVPFQALEYDLGTRLIFLRKDESHTIISGTEAKKEIKDLTMDDNSGLHRLYRGTNGKWHAHPNLVGSRHYDGRLDWLCGEATVQELTLANEALLDRRHGIQDLISKRDAIQKRLEEIAQEQKDFRNSL